MGNIRVVFLWHMHQPFYKDLVTSQYRLPWVRMHGLKDYYGMVKLLDEFPQVHQTFNLVPSFVVQLEDYIAGTARDPFLDVAAKPARDLTPDERRFALDYLFHANPVHMIGRYPRYAELWERLRGFAFNASRAERFFHAQDFTDLQVLSQLAWYDEFFLEDKEIADLVRKGHGFSESDQRLVVARQRDLLARVLPAYASAAQRGIVELSTSPFYHPILPLLCDTNQGAASTPGLPLPQNRFRHSEDAREQLERGLGLHQRVFGLRPKGVWPSEGSVSEEVLGIGAGLGINWMATDEGVLGRSLGFHFDRDGAGRLLRDGPERLYNIYRYEKDGARMHLIFRDHALSDLIGFVYSGMNPRDAAAHFMRRIRESAEPVVRKGKIAIVPVILDGENAWEYYPRSGREFLRRLYDSIDRDPAIAALTVSEAIQRHDNFGRLGSLVPGSWINANFNIWIGAPEDNRAWDYLHAAREFYSAHSSKAPPQQRALAFEEILIAEGSDWNWWYGPEHHSANDRDFDQLYRKHLSNVYQALGASPPDYLAQPIAGGVARPSYVPQSAYIHPRIDGVNVGYFDWIGAAIYTADRRAGAMHGKQFILDSLYAGIDQQNIYGRLDFADKLPAGSVDLVMTVETVPEAATPPSTPANSERPPRHVRVEFMVKDGQLRSWVVRVPESGRALAGSDHQAGAHGAEARLGNRAEFKLPLSLLDAPQGSRLRLRAMLWQNRLPIDALPVEGWMELHIASEEELEANVYG